MVSQRLQEVVFYVTLARAVGGNLQNSFPILPSTLLMFMSDSLGACLQYRVKYSMDIPSWCIPTALLSKDQKIMRSESSLATFDIAMPDIVSSVFHHYGLFVLRLCWSCAAHSKAATNTDISRRYTFHTPLHCADMPAACLNLEILPVKQGQQLDL